METGYSNGSSAGRTYRGRMLYTRMKGGPSDIGEPIARFTKREHTIVNHGALVFAADASRVQLVPSAMRPMMMRLGALDLLDSLVDRRAQKKGQGHCNGLPWGYVVDRPMADVTWASVEVCFVNGQ